MSLTTYLADNFRSNVGYGESLQDRTLGALQLLTAQVPDTVDARADQRYGLRSGDNLTSVLQSFAGDTAVKSLYIPEGSYDVASGAVSVTTDTTITLHPNTRLRRTDTGVGLRFNAPVQWFETCSIAIADSIISEAGTGSTTPHAELTLANAHTVKRGDMLKLVSDDIYADGAFTGSSFPRQGEWVTVAKDSTGTLVTLTALLSDTYTTAPRVFAPSTAKFSWDGGYMDSDLDVSTGHNNHAMLWLQGLVRPQVRNLRSIKSIMPVLTLHGCWNPRVSDCEFGNGETLPALTHLGYGINIVGSEAAQIERITGRHMRHTVTDNMYSLTTAQCADPLNWYIYGRPRYAEIRNVMSFGCSNAGVDFHDEGIGHTVTNCHSVGNYAGSSGSGGGFSARGYGHTFIGCVAYRCRTGFNLYGQADMLIDSCRVIGAQENALELGISDSGPALVSKRNRIRDSFFELNPNSTTSRIVVVNNAGTDAPTTKLVEATFGGNIFRMVGTIHATALFDCKGALIRDDGPNKLDLSDWLPQSDTNRPAAFFFSTQVSDVYFANLLQYDGPTTFGTLTGVGGLVSASSTIASSARFDNVNYVGALGFAGSSNNGNGFASSANVTGVVKIKGRRTLAGTESLTQLISTGAIADGGTISTSKVGDNFMTVYVQNITANRTPAALETTNRANGDSIAVHNRNGSAFTLTVNSVVIAANSFARWRMIAGAWVAE